MAVRNAARHELRNVRFAEGGHDWYAPLQGMRFDLIASNPPYIASDDPHLQQGDLRFEPASALASGVDGLDDIRRIIDGGQAHLLPGGWLLIEHGWDQGAAIRALFDAAGFAEVQTVQDLEQRDRITLGRRPAQNGGSPAPAGHHPGAASMRTLYPAITPYDVGTLKVDDRHSCISNSAATRTASRW